MAEEILTDRHCPACGTKDVACEVVTSADGGHEDDHYRCRACGHDWWVDSIDA